MTTAWQAPYRAPERVQWLLFSRLAQVVMGVALVADVAVLLLAGSTELSLTLHPRPVGWMAALAIGPIFFIVFLTQLLVILSVPARVAARLACPYEQAFRQNDVAAFLFGLIGPRLPLVVRVVQGLTFSAALMNLVVVAARPHPSVSSACEPDVSGFCTASTPPGMIVTIAGFMAFFAALHTIVLAGFVIEQRRARMS